MRRALPLLLALAACRHPLHQGTDAYHDGMRHLRTDPAWAREDFSEADVRYAEALADEDLSDAQRVTGVANRVRVLIELDRHAEAAALLEARLPGYRPDGFYEGDTAGLALVRAAALDPERGYAELLLAEKRAQTARARYHLAWQQARHLLRIGTPRAKAEALKICGQHAGKPEFDALKKSLGN
jgi:hypothetical protein